MGNIDRFTESRRERERPPRSFNWNFLQEPATWFVIAIGGMMIAFISAGIDAYRVRHNHSTESLISLTNPAHVLTAVGLGITTVALLAGLTIAMLRGVEDRDRLIRRFGTVGVAWVLLAVVAVSSLTYLKVSGVTLVHNPGTSLVNANSNGNGGEAGGIVQALQQDGVTADDPNAPGAPTDASKVAGALSQGADGQGGHVHDHGKQPTFATIESTPMDKLLPQFPANTVSAEDLPLLKQQIEQVRAVAEQFPTPESAKAAGYIRTTSDVPFMGEHYLNLNYVKTGIFDPSKPQGLLFSKIDSGEEKLVGVWFLLVPGTGNNKRDVEPTGFAGNLDLWHAHIGLCLVGISGASEGETRESCQAKGGSFTSDLRWMMHVWVAPVQDNPDGVFAYLNNDLYQKQVAAKDAPSASTQNGEISQ